MHLDSLDPRLHFAAYRIPFGFERDWTAPDWPGGVGPSVGGTYVALQSIPSAGGDAKDLRLTRLTPDGARDLTFRESVFAAPVVRGVASEMACQGTVDRQGRLVVVISTRARRGPEISVFRFAPSGKRDTSFGDNGRLTFTPPPLELPPRYSDSFPAIQTIGAAADGAIYAMTNSWVWDEATQNDTDFRAVLRITNDGTLDPRYQALPRSIASPKRNMYRDQMEIDSAGRVYVQTNYKVAGSPGFKSITRLRPLGGIDRAWGDNGSVTIERVGDVLDFALDAQDRLLVTARTVDSYLTNQRAAAVRRYDTAGKIDSTFQLGTTGLEEEAARSDLMLHVTPLSDGRILLHHNQSIVRLRADGRRDPAFDTDGRGTSEWQLYHAIAPESAESFWYHYSNYQPIRFSYRPDVVLHKGSLVITGSDADDAVRITLSGRNRQTLRVRLAGGKVYQFGTRNVARIVAELRGGKDTLFSEHAVPTTLIAAEAQDDIDVRRRVDIVGWYDPARRKTGEPI